MKGEVQMHSRTTLRRVCFTAAAALVALAAATAGQGASRKAPPPTPAKLKADMNAVAKLTGPAREAKLLELAKGEGGGINVYTSLSSLSVKAVQAAWAQKYPDIKLNL